jgi:hypothetical protein
MPEQKTFVRISLEQIHSHTTSQGAVMLEHLFPLQVPPTCRACGLPCEHRDVNDENPNGNGGRPYWTCTSTRHERWKFSCFDDTEGITIGNPQCLCRITSRRTAGRRGDFFSCATGACGWTQSAASRSVWSSPVTPRRSTVAPNGGGFDGDGEVDHGYQESHSILTPPVTPGRSQVAVNRNLTGGHVRMGFGYQTPPSLPGTPEAMTTSAALPNERLAGRDIGRDHGYQNPYSTPSPPEARSRSAVATISAPPVSPSRSRVVANGNGATRDLGMDYDSQRPPATTVPPQAITRPAPAVSTNRNRSTGDFGVDRGYQTPQSTYVPPGARTAPDYDNQTPDSTHELPVEPSRPTAAVAVNANRLGRDDGRDYAYQTPHSMLRPPQMSSRPAPTAATNWNIPEARSIRAIAINELPGGDGSQAYGSQSSDGMDVQPAAPSSPTWAVNGNQHLNHPFGMGFGYREHGRRGDCRALLRWLCGCCGLLGCLTYCCGCELCERI